MSTPAVAQRAALPVGFGDLDSKAMTPSSPGLEVRVLAHVDHPIRARVVAGRVVIVHCGPRVPCRGARTARHHPAARQPVVPAAVHGVHPRAGSGRSWRSSPSGCRSTRSAARRSPWGWSGCSRWCRWSSWACTAGHCRRPRPADGGAGRGLVGWAVVDRQRGVRLAGAPDAVVALPRGRAAERGVRGDRAPRAQSIYPRLLDLSMLPAANALDIFATNLYLTVGPLMAGVLVDRAASAGLHVRRGAVHVRPVGAAAAGADPAGGRPVAGPVQQRRRASPPGPVGCSTGSASSAPAPTCG